MSEISAFAKALVIGLILGIVIGLVAGYIVRPKGVDVTALEEQISNLENQVDTLQTQIKDKDATINSLESQIGSFQEELQTKTNQINELQTKLNEKDAEIKELQTQVTNLKSQIADLEAQIEELEKLVPPLVKGEWNLITTFTGSTDKTTELFHIPSGQWRINWAYTGGELAVFGFFVYKEGETVMYQESLMTMGSSQSDTTHLYVGPGNFYIKLSAANIEQWTLTVEAFVS